MTCNFSLCLLYGVYVMSLEITTLRPEEYEDMMKFLETSYRFSKGFFQRRYPYVWRKETIRYENRIILKKNGQIVLHVGIFPLTMKIGDIEVKMVDGCFYDYGDMEVC